MVFKNDSLNNSAAFLWKQVEGKEFDDTTLADLLVEEYGIDRELAEKDSKAIAAQWLDAGLVE